MKYFQLLNCNRQVIIGDLAFQFAPYEYTGHWNGALATNDEKEIAALTDAVTGKAKNPLNGREWGIHEISEEQYQLCIKKKRTALSSYAPSLAVSVPLKNEAPAPSVEQAVETSLQPPAPEPVAVPLESVAEAVEVVPIKTKRKAA